MDLRGQKYGRLTVLRNVGPGKNSNPVWLCRCECGNSTRVTQGQLRHKTRSCGCLQREAARRSGLASRKHGACVGDKLTPEYLAWRAMLNRCRKKSGPTYKVYGARGIKVCRRWEESFAVFLSDVGPRPSSSHSIDRIDNDAGYSPENVRWSTPLEQGRNKRNNRIILFRGKRITLSELQLYAIGINKSTVHYRIDAGWDPELAITVVPIPGGHHR
jgi:hypothetical protein